MSSEREENIRMLRDSAGAVAPREGGTGRVRALRFGVPGFDRGVWRTICELGWVGLRTPEAAGGAGLGVTEFCALAEELGAGLRPEPLINAACSAVALPPEELAGVLAGDTVVLPAWQEAADTIQIGRDTVIEDGHVTGRKVFVAMAAGADAFLVTVRDGLALVRSDAPGVHLTRQDTQDGGHYATLSLDKSPGQFISGDLSGAIEEATLLTAASLLGVMERSFELSLDYLRTRKQFGRPIGSFQALQHRAADLKLQCALTRASVESAAAVLDSDAPPALRLAAVSRAKARAATAALLVTRQAIQLHGGIGYTDEYDVGLYLRKAMVLANMFGSARVHRARYAAVLPAAGEELN